MVLWVKGLLLLEGNYCPQVGVQLGKKPYFQRNIALFYKLLQKGKDVRIPRPFCRRDMGIKKPLIAVSGKERLLPGLFRKEHKCLGQKNLLGRCHHLVALNVSFYFTCHYQSFFLRLFFAICNNNVIEIFTGSNP
ncbi:MAG: hypothetical protein E4H40_05095 [Candidatus Brocadiia bacterium]|nr:MAG: hypothetical protein E4H40_05095 [Candidatus Brocadiia bacterium]